MNIIYKLYRRILFPIEFRRVLRSINKLALTSTTLAVKLYENLFYNKDIIHNEFIFKGTSIESMIRKNLTMGDLESNDSKRMREKDSCQNTYDVRSII